MEVKKKHTKALINNISGLEEMESMENLQIEFKAIKKATYNFSEANKLGQRGFGIVYMVYLPFCINSSCKSVLSDDLIN